MDWWTYLHPDTPVSAQVVAALRWGFLIWVISLLSKFGHLLYEGVQMARLTRVTPLQGSLTNHLKGAAKPDAPSDNFGRGMAVHDPGPGRVDDDAAVDDVFDDFCRDVAVRCRSVAASHVRAIFASGWENSQLEVDSLVKNTTNRLFRLNGFLRALLSLFIIVGLLGTLFGLAASLAQLSPVMANPSQQQLNTQVGDALRDLLLHLKGAFAPSIWGVFLTIVGVLLYSVYSYFCHYLKDRLERLTHTVWIPKLYPSPFQRQFASLIQTGEMIQNNRENVELVATVAAEIKSDMGGLSESIGSARQVLTELSETSTRITNFADKFHQGVVKLTPFQEQLNALYTKMLHDSQSFHENVRQSVKDSSTFQRQAGEMLLRQGAKIEEILKALNSYESAYIDARHDIDTRLLTVLDEARKAYAQIGERNDEINRAIKDSLGDPLREDLAAKLGAVHQVLGEKLGLILDRFGRFDEPIKNSAEQIAKIAATIDRRALELTAQLRQEYLAQGRVNKQQLADLESLGRHLTDLLTELTEVSKTQGDSATSIKDAVEALAQNLGSLNVSLAAFEQARAATDEAAKAADVERIERQARKHAANILDELDDLKRIVTESGRAGQRTQGGGAFGGEVRHVRHTQPPPPKARPQMNDADPRKEPSPDVYPVETITHDLGVTRPPGTRSDSLPPSAGTTEARNERSALLPDNPSAGEASQGEEGLDEPRRERATAVTWTGSEPSDGSGGKFHAVYSRVKESLKSRFGRR